MFVTVKLGFNNSLFDYFVFSPHSLRSNCLGWADVRWADIRWADIPFNLFHPMLVVLVLCP